MANLSLLQRDETQLTQRWSWQSVKSWESCCRLSNHFDISGTLSMGHSDLPESGMKLSHTWAWMNWCSSKPVFLSWFLECSGKRVWFDNSIKHIVAIKMTPEKHNTTTDGSGLSVNVSTGWPWTKGMSKHGGTLNHWPYMLAIWMDLSKSPTVWDVTWCNPTLQINGCQSLNTGSPQFFNAHLVV